MWWICWFNDFIDCFVVHLVSSKVLPYSIWYYYIPSYCFQSGIYVSLSLGLVDQGKACRLNFVLRRSRAWRIQAQPSSARVWDSPILILNFLTYDKRSSILTHLIFIDLGSKIQNSHTSRLTGSKINLGGKVDHQWAPLLALQLI